MSMKAKKDLAKTLREFLKTDEGIQGNFDALLNRLDEVYHWKDIKEDEK